MDKVILGQGCYVEDDPGHTRPNDNQVLVGATGSGKSLSSLTPTLLHLADSSLLGSYSKAGEARKQGIYLASCGYDVKICDLARPEGSDVGFDVLRYVGSYDDLKGLASQIIQSAVGKTRDEYWNVKAEALLGGFMASVMMTKREEASMADVLELIDQCDVIEGRDSFTTPIDRYFDQFKKQAPKSYASREFSKWRSLPYRTAACVLDTLSAALSATFPESTRKLMRRKEQLDFRWLAREKAALLLITSPVNTSLHFFANLMCHQAVQELLEFSEECPGQRLPRPVKLAFDDFACSAPIKDFPQQISIFRSAGISAILCIQSESQLRSLYGEDGATTILNNCSAYAYFPGGMDLTTCRNISARYDLPLSDVLYAPVGNVFVMRSGQKPVIVPRYDTLHSPEYRRYLRVLQKNEAQGR